MKSLIRIALFVFPILLAPVVFAQDEAKDRFGLSAVFNTTDIPLINKISGYQVNKNVKGFTAEGSVRIFRAGPLSGRLAYDFKQMYKVEVYPDYFNGMKVVDLYRNVHTHSGFAQLGYTVHGAVEPFAALGYGTRKIHEDAPRQTVRTVRFGINIPFSPKSPFFVRASLDYEKPFGKLPMGFANPDAHTLSVGAGFRFY